jgi:hypothetical protein
MTVKELKEKLDKFDENLIVMVPDANWTPDKNWFPCVQATSVTRGVNEFDGCIFIDDYVEEDR